jgi:hypothetical protein
MTLKQRNTTFKPAVMELENRITPSAVLPASTKLPPAIPGPSAVSAPTPGALLVAPQPAVVISFKPLPSTLPYDITIKMQDKAGNKYGGDDGVTFTATAPGVTPAQMRALVKQSMASDGWTVEDGPDTSLLITGKTTAGQFSPVSKISISSKSLKEATLPSIAASTGVQVGQQTQGTNWLVSFGMTSAATTIEQASTVSIILNDSTFTADLLTGMTPEDVAFALYEALSSAGVDAALSGSTIEFLENYDGSEVRQVLLTFNSDDPDSTTTDWLETAITIADREVIG